MQIIGDKQNLADKIAHRTRKPGAVLTVPNNNDLLIAASFKVV